MKTSITVPAITIKVSSGETFNYINPKTYLKGLIFSEEKWTWYKHYDDLFFIEHLKNEATECSGFIFVKNGRWIAFKDIIEVTIEQDDKNYSCSLLVEDEDNNLPKIISLKKNQ